MANDQLLTRNYLDARLSPKSAEMASEFTKMKSDIIKWIAAMLVVQTAVIVAIVKLLS